MEQTSEIFKQTFDLANDAMIIHDNSGRILLANKKACQILHYTQAEILEKNIADVDSLSTSMQWFENDPQLEEIDDDICEVYFIKKDQTLVPAESTVQLIDYQGSTAAFLIFRDISQRKQIEAALYESMIRYQSYLNSAPDSIFITDQSGKIQEVNTAFTKLMNYSQGELLGLNIIDLISGKNKSQANLFFGNLKNQYDYKRAFILKDKEDRTIDLLISGERISADKYIWFGKNLAELKDIKLINGYSSH